MLKRLPAVLGLLLLAGCGMVGGGPLTRQEIARLPNDVLTQRLVMQMGLTVSDVPIERNRLGQTFLHTRGYENADGQCRQDILYVTFDRKTKPDGPVVARGFNSEASYASPQAWPGVKDCADPRLRFFRVHSFRGTPGWIVARDGMALLLKARSSSDGATMECAGANLRTRDDCKALLAAFPIDDLHLVFDCDPEKGGKCTDMFTGQWNLSINSAADGRIVAIRLRPNMRL